MSTTRRPSPPLRTRAWRLALGGSRTLARLGARPPGTPAFLIVGAQRAGTTSLYEYLEAHPGVRFPRLQKGLHFFTTSFDRGEDWYRSQFPALRSLERRGQITGEASPYYLFHPFAAERIAAVLPDVRIVMVLRDPVTRAWSHYHHEVARGHERLPFEQAIAAEDERLAGEMERVADPSYYSPALRHHAYVGRGRYADQLERYRRVLPSERILVLESARLARATQTCFDELTTFLGLAQHELTRLDRHNARSYPPLDPETVQQLAARFSADNERLFELLGHRFPWITPGGASR